MRKWKETVIATHQRGAERALAIGLRRSSLIAALLCVTHAAAVSHPPGPDGVPAPNNHARAGNGGPVSQQQAAEAQADPAHDDSALTYEIEEDCE